MIFFYFVHLQIIQLIQLVSSLWDILKMGINFNSIIPGNVNESFSETMRGDIKCRPISFKSLPTDFCFIAIEIKLCLTLRNFTYLPCAFLHILCQMKVLSTFFLHFSDQHFHFICMPS